MNSNLTVFEENGIYLADSREVAILIEKNHKELLRDIRRYCNFLTASNNALSEYFIEYTYKDSTGRDLPCYLCTKKGCDLIANKLTGKKGVIFTAKYVSAFEKMKEFIEKGKRLNSDVPFDLLVKSVDIVAGSLRVNDASRILMYKKLYEEMGQPTGFLPSYEFNNNQQLQSATSLLREFGLDMSAKEFNERMREYGFLERKSRKSSKGKTKYFNSLNENGLRFGENAISPHNQLETQPLYYHDGFEKLLQELDI